MQESEKEEKRESEKGRKRAGCGWMDGSFPRADRWCLREDRFCF